MRVILFFIDGLGLAPACLTNPLAALDLPFMQKLLGGKKLTAEALGSHGSSVLLALDSCLSVPGEPQSATGQTTLFTGVNAALAVGRHIRGFPTQPLRRLLAKEGLLQKVISLGKTALFLNSYRPQFFKDGFGSRRLYSVTTWLNYYAGLPFLTLDDLVSGRAVNNDITNEQLIALNYQVPRREPEEAGKILAQRAAEVDFLLFEYFLTDKYGHERDREKIAAALLSIDRFLEGIFAGLDTENTLFILTSDHGNLEDLSTAGHTKNPVPLLLVGPGLADLPEMRDLTVVTPFVLQRLQGASAGGACSTDSFRLGISLQQGGLK
ncbi:MAG: alkaline phosphatase family protein [Bacillota bacterium]|jgi:2,3-bisphosphoglycerate-independent phosphoglycerate mutase|nr:alkaline phosphatase family protein [Bacillota bacterium]HHU30034.1 hypothetical protein [Bacillota bacterium]